MLFLLFIALASAANFTCQGINRDLLLDCFTKHVDLNHDGNLSREEVAVVVEPTFFSICDMNMDHVLNLYDWNHPIGCCKFDPCIYKVCDTCFNRFNWTGV